MLLNAKLKYGKTGQKQLTGRSPLWRLRTAMDCNAIEERKKNKRIRGRSVQTKQTSVFSLEV
jgi:hypothetical protein